MSNFNNTINNKSKLTERQLNEMLRSSVYGLSNTPSADGKSAEQIKKAMYDFILHRDSENEVPSVVNTLDAIIDYVNDVKEKLLENTKYNKETLEANSADLDNLESDIQSVDDKADTNASNISKLNSFLLQLGDYNSSTDTFTPSPTKIGLGNVVNTGDSDEVVENGTSKFTNGGAYDLKQALLQAISSIQTDLSAVETNITKITNGTTTVGSATNASIATYFQDTVSGQTQNVSIKAKFDTILGILDGLTGSGGTVSGIETLISSLTTQVNDLESAWSTFTTGTSADNVINTLSEIRTSLTSLQTQIDSSLKINSSYTYAQLVSMAQSNQLQEGTVYFPTDDPLLTQLNANTSAITTLQNDVDAIEEDVSDLETQLNGLHLYVHSILIKGTDHFSNTATTLYKNIVILTTFKTAITTSNVVSIFGNTEALLPLNQDIDGTSSDLSCRRYYFSNETQYGLQVDEMRFGYSGNDAYQELSTGTIIDITDITDNVRQIM